MKDSPENLKRGNFIVVTSNRDYEENREFTSYQGSIPIQQRRPPLHYSGVPAEVLSVAIPFVVVKFIETNTSNQEPTGPEAIDIRIFNVMKVDKQYAQSFITTSTKLSKGTLTPIAYKKEKEHRYPCPCCEASMVERRTGQGQWGLSCKQCTFSGTRKKGGVGDFPN